MDRQRGKAALPQGERKAACTCAFPSSPRKKSQDRVPVIEESVPGDDDEVGMENAVRFLLDMQVNPLMHLGRCTLAETRSDGNIYAAGICIRERHAMVFPGRRESHRSLHLRRGTPDHGGGTSHAYSHLQRTSPERRGDDDGRYLRFRSAPSAIEAWKRSWEHFGTLDWHE